MLVRLSQLALLCTLSTACSQQHYGSGHDAERAGDEIDDDDGTAPVGTSLVDDSTSDEDGADPPVDPGSQRRDPASGGTDRGPTPSRADAPPGQPAPVTPPDDLVGASIPDFFPTAPEEYGRSEINCGITVHRTMGSTEQACRFAPDLLLRRPSDVAVYLDRARIPAGAAFRVDNTALELEGAACAQWRDGRPHELILLLVCRYLILI